MSAQGIEAGLKVAPACHVAYEIPCCRVEGISAVLDRLLHRAEGGLLELARLARNLK
jgi:hypothetical protein